MGFSDSGSASPDSAGIRRETTVKGSSVPPPVNRADKPKLVDKISTLQPEEGGKAHASLALVPKSAEGTVTLPGAPGSNEDRPKSHKYPNTSKSGRNETLQDTGLVGRANPAHPSVFEPPPIHHSVAQKLRDQQDREGFLGSAAPADTLRNPRARSSTPRDIPEYRPGLPPRRQTGDSNLDRPPARMRAQSSSPSDSTNAGSKSAAFSFADSEVKFPPPPRRSSALDSAEGNDTQMQIPNRHRDQAPRSVSTSTRPPAHPPSTNRKVPVDNLDDDERGSNSPSNMITDYPDCSQANRRWPHPRGGPHEIHTKHEVRQFAICGDHVCCAGYVTRIWNIHDGEIMSLNLGEASRVTSLAFKACTNPDDEGKWVWLGTDNGEIHEIDISAQMTVFVKTSAHLRREVIKIHRHANEMWTLDDEGKLHVWPPDETGSPNLRYSHQTFRVPKGHSFSLVVGNELWLATGKDIRVFQPSSDADVQFDVLAKPLYQAGAGEVTSGTMIGSKSEKVFFSHTDGKVTIYSRKDYACLGVVNVSSYKINSLSGVGGYLWAAFNTGKIYVYETGKTPWTVKKDWHAHSGPVVDILVDPSSVWKLEQLQVASLGADNLIRLWDGMLQVDWLGRPATSELQDVPADFLWRNADSAMDEHDVEYCSFREITALVTTWNVGASMPQDMRRDERDDDFFRRLCHAQEPPDLLVFGFQELIDLEDKKVTASTFIPWRSLAGN